MNGAPPVPATIDDVIARLTALGEQFESQGGPNDGVLCFNRVYLAVTQGVKRAVEQPEYFHDPITIARLDVIFAELYFDAVLLAEAGGHPALAWRALFDARARTDLLPIQFAAAGMNAHINHDLPLALLELWEADGVRPETAGSPYADYLKINEIIKLEQEKEKAQLEPILVRDYEALDPALLGRLDDRLALWVVEEARARAWETAGHLWDVRHLAAARNAWMATADVFVGALSRTLLESIFET